MSDRKANGDGETNITTQTWTWCLWREPEQEKRAKAF